MIHGQTKIKFPD